MLEHVGRKITLILILVAVSLALLLLPEKPVRLGLDLAGGTRLIYFIDIDKAREEGSIDASETDAQVLEDTIAIIRQRIDPQGVLEPVIRRAGVNRIEIALPSEADTTTSAAAPLAEPVAERGTAPLRLSQESEEEVRKFPSGGGVVSIGRERLAYEARVANELQGLERGYQKSEQSAHEAGEEVTLVSDDAIRNAIENLGDMQFYIAAKPGDFTSAGADLTTEQEKAQVWAAANVDVPLANFNRLTRENNGPPPGIRWFPMALEEGAEPVPVADRLVPVIVPKPEWIFTGDDLARVYRTQAASGYPAVGFETKPSKRIPFGEFTEEYVNEGMAIVLNDEIVSLATINEPLLGSAIIRGRFTVSKVESQVRVLRSGSLKIKPVLEAEERVGATLGHEYVSRGFTSVLLGLTAVLAFMVVYYRRLGVFAVIALLINLLLLAGAMSGLQATLTLPGIAGIILTVGMAVDANILIFDRLREESDKGHKIQQAAINGFKNATSAIIDANVTTLITALILMNVGTGPVRGFAVTLSIGILTSVFSALVITRVLVHLQLERKIPKFSMGSWLAKADFDFIGKTKLAAVASTLAVVGGLGLFFATPDTEKLGIDFLGGSTVKIRTEESQTTADLRTLVAQIPGVLGESAEVVELPSSGTGDGRFRAFRITFKNHGGEETSSDSRSQGGGESSRTSPPDQALLLRSEMRTALASVLQKGPIDVSVEEGQATDRAELVLYFEDEHPTADLTALLQTVSVLSDATVATRAGREDVHVISGSVTPGTRADDLGLLVRNALRGQTDSNGTEFILAEPIPEASTVSGQVVGELRDSAIKAILLSLFLVVLYIRARFAEYRYGMAAVVAVVHDVLITLGAIALMVKVGIVDVELNLPMIAAFLTIVGYSLNDTIVIFDRVRENLPRVKGTLPEVVNLSINQTLSRTIMTSVTTLLTLVMLFAFSYGTGSVLEGFSFAMIVGLISGTYSTIFIATPVLLWLAKRSEASHGSPSGEKSKKKKVATVAS